MSKVYYVLDEGKLQEYEEDFITFNDYLPLLLRESVYFILNILITSVKMGIMIKS